MVKMNKTKFMSRMFSDYTPDEEKQEVIDKIEEAKVNGSSSLVDGENHLEFAALDDSSVIVEDKSNGEVTKVTENPEDEDDLLMEPVDVDDDDDDEEGRMESSFCRGKSMSRPKRFKTTRFMSRMFSDDTPDYEKQEVIDKIEEAKENGSATLIDGENNLEFTAVDDSTVLVNDNDTGEVTKVTENPEDEDDLELEKVESKSYNRRSSRRSRRYYSSNEYPDSLPDAEVEIPEGEDGDHIEDTVPEIEVSVDTGITDPEKAGMKTYSLRRIRLKGISDPVQAARILKNVHRAFADSSYVDDLMSPTDLRDNDEEEEMAADELVDSYSRSYSRTYSRRFSDEPKDESKDTEAKAEDKVDDAGATPIETLLGENEDSKDANIEPKINPNETEDDEKVFSTIRGGKSDASIYFEPF